MAGLFRAYGQIRRGTGPWRKPFLIPVGDLEPPFIQGSSNVSIDTNGTAPDLRLALVLQSVDQYPALAVQFRIQPIPGRVIRDITLRMVLLKSGDSPFLDSGPLESDVSFAVLHYRVGPTGVFPPEVRIDLNTGVGADDFDSTVVVAPNPPETFPTGHRRITADRVALSVTDAPNGWPMDVAGGIVEGDMVSLAGVETDYNSLLNSGYVEHPVNIRGIALGRLEDGASPTSPLPKTATWLEIQATPTSAVPPGKSRQIFVDLRTPTRGDAPKTAPTATENPGGALRIGSYRYSTTFVHKNKNESGSSPKTAPIKIDAAKRSVLITDLPTAPPTPVPDTTSLEVTHIRIYRTDCDQSVDPTDIDRGNRGEEVLVAQLPIGTTTYTDNGPTHPDAEPTLHDDFMSIRYWSSLTFDLTGTMRMLEGADDTRYGGSVSAAPEYLKVLYRPGATPKLRWLAPSSTPRLSLDMPSMKLPYGTGLAASLEQVPTKFSLDWRILGSEFTGLSLAGDVDVIAGPGPDPAIAPARVSVRMGTPVVPSGWPNGEPEAAVELADLKATSPLGLISLSELRRARLSIGSSTWDKRDVEMGLVRVDALFVQSKTTLDRRLRFGYTSASGQDLLKIDGTAHFVPSHVNFNARLTPGAGQHFNLNSRMRFVRAGLSMRATGDDPSIGTRITGHAFADDTTDSLVLSLAAGKVELATKWPLRAGAGLRFVSEPPVPNDEPIGLWADVIVPDSIKSTTALPLEFSSAAPGVSGRAAVTWSSQNPLAVRANPQVKALINGSAESPPGVRALSARVLNINSAIIPAGITAPFAPNPPPTSEVSPILQFGTGRPNRSFRVEMQQVETRVPTPPDLWSVDPARSWLRARTSLLPDKLEPHVLWSKGSLAGASLKSSQRWGDGVIWAEPRLGRTDNAAELGGDQGVGILSAGFDGVPTNVEFWMLAHSDVLGSRVADSDRRPTVGPVGADWPPGGVLLRVDDAIRLSHILVALPEGDGQVCRSDDGPKHAVRHGKWFSVISPFVKIEPTTTGTKQLIMWSTQEPADPSAGGSGDPCSGSGGGGDDKSRKSALGWSIQDDSSVSMALRIYELVTPSGVVAPRWWSMPTGDEEWGGEDVHTGIWGLQQEIQTKEYAGTVVLYPKESTDNPFGDWEGGQGKWWLRQRGGLDVPLFLLFGWGIASGDVYMGNVGGGYHMPGTNGIFSTLPKLWTWSYP